jgi:uncharacterized protein YdhG (YjbR/CyaY superfamily)
MDTKVATIDQYIAAYPAHVQDILQKVRKVVAKAAPDATEKIGYGIPTFVYKGNLVHFAAYARHIGFYPGSAGIETFKKDLAGYKTSKGAVQFPLDKPIPYDLIEKITVYRYEENTSKLRK